MQSDRSKTRIDLKEWSRYYRLPESRVEALHARFITHQYPRHAHSFFVVGLIKSGAQSYWYRGARQITPEGQVFLVNPDEPHTGETASPDGYAYQTLYIEPDALLSIARDITGVDGVPNFCAAVVEDPILADALTRCHNAIASTGPRVHCECLFLVAMKRLLTAHGEYPCNTVSIGKERTAVMRAREYIEANYADNVSLAQLAQLASLSPYYLARAFEKDVGLAPHQYLEGVRIARAKELLCSGESIASTAISVGYADQSHLSRRFKRFVGASPGQFVAQAGGRKWR